MSESRGESSRVEPRITLKAAVVAALEPAQAVVLREALDQLAAMPLNVAPRWRVQQIEHCLCEKESAKGLDEP